MARKAIKKGRAALRLLRGSIAKTTYRRENAALRSAAHVLDPVRDASVLLAALQATRARYRSLAGDQATAALARALRRRRQQANRELEAQPQLLAMARGTLRQVDRRARHWRVARRGWSGLGPGFERIYRTGRRTGRAARAHPDPPSLHEWRKQVQYLRHALQIIHHLQAGAAPKASARARRLAEYLGEDHDLALLRASALAYARAHELDCDALVSVIDRRRRELQRKALPLGRRLYGRSAPAMAAHIGQSRAWR